jgi:LmbE family N-acetylglucosaminyl deacetylase
MKAKQVHRMRPEPVSSRAQRGISLLARLLFALGLSADVALAQSAGAIPLAQDIQGLGTTTRVLMIGAHPDDEDTQLIAWLAKARHIETAYLSLTRGDGGQNLIGNELGPMLGMIRTEELLAARRIDGGRQYFTRAYDFGFSKTYEETRRRWPHDSILKDMIAIVRAFKPHVIVDVWSGTPQDGHGHHQYAGVLGREVFDAAADSVKWPGTPWIVSKFYRGRRANGNLQFNVGELDPLTGRTYSEIATISRSQHRSQGQGELPQPGRRLDGVQLEVSRVSSVSAPETGLFSGLDTSWKRFAAVSLPDSSRRALDSLPIAERAVVAAVDLLNPSKMVPSLAAYLALATRVDRGTACRRPCGGLSGDLELALAKTIERATDALMQATGVRIEVTAPRAVVAREDTMSVTVSLFNQHRSDVYFGGATLVPSDTFAGQMSTPVRSDSVLRIVLPMRGARVSKSWWLESPQKGDTFDQPVSPMRMGEDRLLDSGVQLFMTIAGAQVAPRVGPVVNRRADAVLGEIRRPIATVPAVSVLLDHTVEYARAGVSFDRTFRVVLRSGSTAAETLSVSLRLPPGLAADSATKRVTLAPFTTASVFFRVQGRLAERRDSIVARVVDTRGKRFTEGYVPIEYDHIRPLRYYRPAVVQIEAVNATFANLRVGYIRGVGDNVMPMLEELGLPVTEIDPAVVPRTDLSKFTTIVIGPRAYQADPAVMNAATPSIMQFVRNGGTVVTQYGQQEMTQQPGPLPYAIAFAGRTADRVTDETAPVRVLDAGSPLLAQPNKIAAEDFNGWVQERSLYMPRTFDAQWRALFSMNDPNEPPNDGAVLVAPVGTGVYVYTTMSFFRQLPAGHPGAAKLFINLLSADSRAAMRPSVRSQTPRP